MIENSMLYLKYLIFAFFISDVVWDPINDSDDADRKYLWLTEPESSHMEYPEEWKNRMEIWDEVMKEL